MWKEIDLPGKTRNIFNSFKSSDKAYGGYIDYTDLPVSVALARMMCEAEEFQKGTPQQLEAIFADACRVVSPGAGSGRMDIVFNEQLIATGNTNYVYVAFDIASKPEATRIDDWLDSRPEMQEKVKIIFERNCLDLSNYYVNGKLADLVIMHNFLDTLNHDNRFDAFCDRLGQASEEGSHLMITMGGTRDKIINNFVNSGFREVIRIGDREPHAAVIVLRR